MANKVKNQKVRKPSARTKAGRKLDDSAPEQNVTIHKEGRSTKDVNVQILFIFLLVSFFTTVYLLAFSNRLTSNIQVASNKLIQIQVEITSDRYRAAYTDGNKEVQDCSSEATYSGISNSTVHVNQSNGKPLGETELGAATAFNYTKCTFKTSLGLESDFSGGEVMVYVKFPFAKSEVFEVDLGTEPPYKIDLEFNLD